jgi:hypothetical protein
MESETDPTSTDDPSQNPGPARERRARKAGEAATNGDRLLPGEDPARADATDATVWVDVYSELLTFKQELLRLISARIAEMRHDSARREAEETDAVVVRAEAERLAGRLGFWRGRLEELSS